MDVYLAGCENYQFDQVLEHLEYPFRLSSYLHFRDEAESKKRDLQRMNRTRCRRIMDSGLFSFMFGAAQGALKNFDDYLAYAKQYVAFMQQEGWRETIVECDVQKVLGVKETFRLRDEVFRPSGFEVMYVWHIPEGEDGLRELARTEKRIALSVPELRQVYSTNEMTLWRKLLRLIKIARDAGNAKIHLLGNTVVKLLTLPADSADSTSWLSSGRFGVGYIYRPGGGLEQASIYSPKWAAWLAYAKKMIPQAYVGLGDEVYAQTEKGKKYYGNCLASALAFKLLMQEMELHG